MDYQTLDDAVFDAAMAAQRADQDRTEYISLVYRAPDGAIRFTDPQGGTHRASASAKIAFPKGSELLALVHNHSQAKGVKENSGQDRFSPEDRKQAAALGVPSFIVFGENSAIRRLLPGSRNLKGEEFLHIPEVQPAGEYIGIKRLTDVR